MKFSLKMEKLRRDQRGFTLVEMLAVVALIGIIAGGIAMTISQILTINTSASNHMIAVRQVQQAGKEVSRDTLQAQNVTPDEDSAPGFPLTLEWIDSENYQHEVIYSLEDMPSRPALRMLERSHTVDGSTTTTVIARYIDPGNTECFKDGRKLIFTVTARIGGWPREAVETRTYEIDPRPTGS